MRSAIIDFRDHPSILFGEAGDTIVTAEEMQPMVGLRKRWDPYGGRALRGAGLQCVSRPARRTYARGVESAGTFICTSARIHSLGR